MRAVQASVQAVVVFAHMQLQRVPAGSVQESSWIVCGGAGEVVWVDPYEDLSSQCSLRLCSI